MPEGVEVKISAELVKPLVINRPIIQAQYTKNSRYASEAPEGYKEFIQDISSNRVPTHVTDVQTKGKFMYWTFSNGWYLMCTFGMSGQWSPKEGKHPCFFFTFATQTGHEDQMFFNDPRHFGTIKFVKDKKVIIDKLNDLGWDPLQNQMNDYIPFLKGKLGQSIKPIAELLMDQTLFAGVGNYIRAEALYLAKMSPWRQANLMKETEIRNLCQAIVDVMNESYQHQGATIQTYKTPYGAEGKYSSCFKVYGKKADPLGNQITKQNTADGRAIHWCPAIQI